MNIITHTQLVDWLNSLAQNQPLYAPQKEAEIVLYRPVKTSNEIAWDYTRPQMSIKDIFFPPSEQLMIIEKSGQEVFLTETFSDTKPVLFGVRPCDARGMQMLDALFIDKNPADPYYTRRRENATLIGLACKEMGPSCFCTSIGGAPNDISGMDIMLTEADGGYILQSLTEKGEAILEGLNLAEFHGELPEPLITSPLPLLEKETWLTHFDDEYWERMAERCLSCRICAYVCPTCRCFSVRDEALHSQGKYERIRCWDSCAGENYRRIAGGHKPRSEKGERLRNRFMCKFYYFPAEYRLEQSSACTGCGRCVDACPVNIDITEVLTEVGRLP